MLVALGGCDPERPDEMPGLRGAQLRAASVVLDAGADRSARKPPGFELVAVDAGLRHSGDWPCSDCHEYDPEDPPNTSPRTLEYAHEDVKLHHGAGRMWCLECHHARERDRLVGDEGAPLAPDQAHKLCARCHSAQARDFAFGVHGRRVGTYRGERRLLPCVSCHSAHAPAIAPRRPATGPRPRADLPAPITPPEEPLPHEQAGEHHP
jgi:hypothetical protein